MNSAGKEQCRQLRSELSELKDENMSLGSDVERYKDQLGMFARVNKEIKQS